MQFRGNEANRSFVISGDRGSNASIRQSLHLGVENKILQSGKFARVVTEADPQAVESPLRANCSILAPRLNPSAAVLGR
jgi:hypothetical protein